MDNKIQNEVLSEVALQELLNIEKPVLNSLRLNKGLPYIKLTIKRRVYLASEVMDWLKQQQRVS